MPQANGRYLSAGLILALPFMILLVANGVDRTVTSVSTAMSILTVATVELVLAVGIRHAIKVRERLIPTNDVR